MKPVILSHCHTNHLLCQDNILRMVLNKDLKIDVPIPDPKDFQSNDEGETLFEE